MSQNWLELARLNAPFLMLALPLTGAALALVTPSAKLSWVLSGAAAVASALLSVDMAWRVLLSGAPTNFAIVGVALHVDGIAAFAAPLLASAGALVIVAGGAFRTEDAPPRTTPLALALFSCAMAGWIGALFAPDFTALLATDGTAWFASVALVALCSERDRGGLSGAFRMLSAGAGAAALIGLGVAAIGRGAGSLSIDALGTAPISAPDLAAIGVGLVVLGLALQAGAAPLHFWIGAAYGRANGWTALALGGLSTIGALGVLLRVAASALAAPAIEQGLSFALLALGLASAVAGSVQAIGARNLRRLAAYAGTTQTGCVLVSAALGSTAGLAASLVQLTAQTAAALALFGGFMTLDGKLAPASLDGWGRRAPLASLAIAAAALSLMGAPLTLGFLGRWRVVEAGVHGGWWWAALAVILASLAAISYGGRLIERLYFRRASEASETRRDFWRIAVAPALLAAVLTIAIGLAPAPLLEAAESAARLFAGEGS